MKTCTSCKQEKSLDQFRRVRGYKGGIHSQCKACESERLKRWRADHPDQRKAQTARVNAKNRELRKGAYNDDPAYRELRKMHSRDAHLRRKYGISLDDLLALYESQDGKCAACGKDVFLTHINHGPTVNRACVDHCHATGKVRAILCDRCNRIIGHADESAAVLAGCLRYVESIQIA